MKKIVIIGAGSMGTAFAYPCIDNNLEVNIIGTHLEYKSVNLLNKSRLHQDLNLKINKNIKFFHHENIKDVFKKRPDLVVIGVSSKGIDWIADELKKISLNGKLPNLLMLTKGLSIHDDKYETLVDKLKRLLSEKGVENINLSAVGGPCLAQGLANRVHSAVVIANKNLDTALDLKKLLSTEYYHISVSSDINGVEICAAIKNIFSMIIGAAEKLNKSKDKNNFYLNTSAALINQSIYEMEIFTDFLNGKKESVNGLAGLGDLYVSAVGGRNSKMGAYIGDGITYSNAKKNKMARVTVEGAELIFEIGKKVKQDFDDKKLPLMISMIDAILEDKQFVIRWNNFKK